MKINLEINRKQNKQYNILSESPSYFVHAKWSTSPPVLCKVGSSTIVRVKCLQWIVFLPLKLVQHFVSGGAQSMMFHPSRKPPIHTCSGWGHHLKLWANSSGGYSDGLMACLHSDYGYERHSNNQCIPAFWFSPSSLSKDCNVGQNYWNSTG